MTMNILGFGIVKDIFGSAAIHADLPDNETIGDLRQILENKYPRLKQLKSYLVAKDNEYADMNDILLPNNEIAIIPPVSGG